MSYVLISFKQTLVLHINIISMQIIHIISMQIDQIKY